MDFASDSSRLLLSIWHVSLGKIKIALTLPVSSAHDERAFSCLKRVKTYLRSTMTEQRLSNLACIAINRDNVLRIAVRNLQKPFLSTRTRNIFNL